MTYVRKKTECESGNLKKCTAITIILIGIGTVIALLGSLSVPLAYSITFFWPAIAVQVVGGIWFGWWGILAGTSFPIISNYMINAPTSANLIFIPANFIQSFFPVFLMQRLKADIRLPRAKDHIVFVLGIILSNLISALWSVTALYAQGFLSPSDLTKYYLAWSIGNILPAIILGEILLKIFSESVMETSWFCCNWFS